MRGGRSSVVRTIRHEKALNPREQKGNYGPLLCSQYTRVNLHPQFIPQFLTMSRETELRAKKQC